MIDGSLRPSRNDFPREELLLPECPIPRPDDEIVWYLDARQVSGTLMGHDPKGQPVAQTTFGNIHKLGSFDYLRLKNPLERRKPNWFYLGPSAQIQSPHPEELDEFNRILSQRIPPGPKYYELVTEIWCRGYEVFLVGGTVRDVIAGVSTNDVDLVTSMPLSKAVPLLTSMYRREPDRSEENGFVRLGGKPGSGDPFIDLKMFTHHEPGTPNALFGARFDYDVYHRDFACNSVYYDPINKVLIDPTGTGILDAENKRLCLVCDVARRAPFHCAQISIRFFKFMSRGFSAPSETIDRILQDFVPALAAMQTSTRIRYIRTQILSKRPKNEHQEALERLKTQMFALGAGDGWMAYIEPVLEEILQ
jgi:hypothetical protein